MSFLLGLLTGCNESYVTYKGPDYVMFADTLQTLAIQDDETYYDVPVSVTTACDYDRTYAVEVVDEGSNAIEGKHYDLASNNVTIKAGELSSSVRLRGYFSNFEDTDSIGVMLRLVADKSKLWDIYGTDTKVVLQKVCPFSLDTFTGYAKLTSTFFDDYMQQTSVRLLETRVSTDSEDAPNTIILPDYLYDGYDIKVTFNTENPLEPILEWEPQVVGTTAEAFAGSVWGDDKLRVKEPDGVNSYFNVCQNFILQYMTFYVENVGTVGTYISIVEWISEAEYKKLKAELGQ